MIGKIHGNKYTQEEFIKLLVLKHGDKYNYSNTENWWMPYV